MFRKGFLFILLLSHTTLFANDIPNYTVSTVYQAPANAALGQLVVKNDTLYVASHDNSTVIKVSPDGTGEVFAGGAGSPSLLVTFTLPDGPFVATEVSIGVLTNIAIDPQGNLYTQVARNTWKITPNGQLSLFAGTKALTFPTAPISGLDGQATDAVIPQPGGQGGAAIDQYNNVYLRASTTQPQIVKVDTSGIVTLYAGNGERGNAGDGGPAPLAQLTGLGEIAADTAGNLYLAEADDGIRKITPDGIITTILSDPSSSTRVLKNDIIDKVGARDADFGTILYLAAGPDGSVFYVASGGSTVYQISPDGLVSTIAGNGTEGFEGDGGPGRSAAFQFIHGLVVDPSGNVYVSDRNNLRIRKLTRDTPLTTNSDTSDGEQTGDGMTEGNQDSTTTGSGDMNAGASDSTSTGEGMTNIGQDSTATDGDMTGETSNTPAFPTEPIARTDFDDNNKVDFGDFLAFAGAFGKKTGEDGYDARIDLDDNGEIAFSDFLSFASVFGQDVPQ